MLYLQYVQNIGVHVQYGQQQCKNRGNKQMVVCNSIVKNVWSMKNISAIFLYKVNCALYSNTVIDQCIRCKILIDY